jgi:hypothetical protein
VEEYFRSHGRATEEMVFSGSAKVAYRWVPREKSKQ